MDKEMINLKDEEIKVIAELHMVGGKLRIK